MQALSGPIPFDVLRGCWARIKDAARPAARRRRARRRAAPAIDPVALTILAVNRLGPATFRTVSLGTAVTVTVPDPRIGEIFRAALQEMQKARSTDRLISIAIDAAPSRPRVGAEA